MQRDKIKQLSGGRDTYFLFCSSGGLPHSIHLPAVEIPAFPPCSGLQGCGQSLGYAARNAGLPVLHWTGWCQFGTPISYWTATASLRWYSVVVWPPHGCGPLEEVAVVGCLDEPGDLLNCGTMSGLSIGNCPVRWMCKTNTGMQRPFSDYLESSAASGLCHESLMVQKNLTLASLLLASL